MSFSLDELAQLKFNSDQLINKSQKYTVIMMLLCHLFSMLLIKANKLYYQQKIKPLTKTAHNQQLFLVKMNHT